MVKHQVRYDFSTSQQVVRKYTCMVETVNHFFVCRWLCGVMVYSWCHTSNWNRLAHGRLSVQHLRLRLMPLHFLECDAQLFAVLCPPFSHIRQLRLHRDSASNSSPLSLTRVLSSLRSFPLIHFLWLTCDRGNLGSIGSHCIHFLYGYSVIQYWLDTCLYVCIFVHIFVCICCLYITAIETFHFFSRDLQELEERGERK